MFAKLFNVRFLLLLVVLFLLIDSVVFILIGVSYSIHGYKEIIGKIIDPSSPERPGLLLIEGLDVFMVAIVFMIFGLGTARLFIFGETDNKFIPKWLDINNFKELKILIWETILVTLVITSLGDLIKGPRSVESLYFPLIILILTLALFLTKLKDNKT